MRQSRLQRKDAPRANTIARTTRKRSAIHERAARDETRDSRRQRGINDGYCGADSYGVVQLYDVAGTHPDTSITHVQTNVPFLRCAVNVNVACECVRVLRLASSQPENTRDDWIATRGIRCNNFAGASSIFEHSTRWRLVADFLCDLQFAKRSATAARPIAKTEFGCGDWKDDHQVRRIERGYFLLGCTDHDVVLRVRCGAGRDDDYDPADKSDATEDVDLAANCHERLNLKKVSAVSVVASAISCNERPRAAAIVSATMRVCAGSHRFPRNGTGARYGQSVSTMNFQNGTLAATWRTLVPFLNVTMPVNETK